MVTGRTISMVWNILKPFIFSNEHIWSANNFSFLNMKMRLEDVVVGSSWYVLYYVPFFFYFVTKSKLWYSWRFSHYSAPFHWLDNNSKIAYVLFPLYKNLLNAWSVGEQWILYLLHVMFPFKYCNWDSLKTKFTVTLWTSHLVLKLNVSANFIFLFKR